MALLVGAVLVVAGSVVPGAGGSSAGAVEPSAGVPVSAPEEQTTSVVPADERDAVLGKGWESSADVAWTSVGDATGFHVLVADEDQGLAPR
ncbi:MAG: hypothetical protein GXX79_13250 [Actinomycetales bacterium]|nr:hypothetical protein [Actinomycetales bacterium]